MQRRALDLHLLVDRHRLGVEVKIGQLGDQACPFAARLAHADDAALRVVHRLTPLQSAMLKVLDLMAQQGMLVAVP